MKLSTPLRAAAAAVALASAALPAAAQYSFNATDVAAFGGPSYGSVDLTQNGLNVDFSVVLRDDLNFLTTGGHNVFAFNGTDVSLADITNIHDAGTQTFSVVVPGSTRRSDHSASASSARPNAALEGRQAATPTR